MEDFAPQRGSHPFRSVVTVADLLGRTNGPFEPDPIGPPLQSRVTVSARALLRRSGADGAHERVEATADRTVIGLDTSRRRLITSGAAVLAVSSLAGAAIMFSDATTGPAGSQALDGGYPGKALPGRQDRSLSGHPSVVDGLPPAVGPVVFSPALPAPAGTVGLPTSVTSRGVVPGAPSSALPAPTVAGPVVPSAVVAPSSSGGLAGGTAGGAVGRAAGGVVGEGGGLVSGTATSVGDNLGGPLGGPVSALGDTVSGSTRALGRTVDSTVGTVGGVVQGTTSSLRLGGLNGVVDGLVGGGRGTTQGLLGGATASGGKHRAADTPSMSSSERAGSPAGPALSSLTKPITKRDAGDVVGGLLGSTRSSSKSSSPKGSGSSSRRRDAPGDLVSSVTGSRLGGSGSSGRHAKDDGDDGDDDRGPKSKHSKRSASKRGSHSDSERGSDGGSRHSSGSSRHSGGGLGSLLGRH